MLDARDIEIKKPLWILVKNKVNKQLQYNLDAIIEVGKKFSDGEEPLSLPREKREGK